jgi:NADH dehydrogenase [ubiquinone] 1 alpha subcomplex assembly factor 7
VVPEFRDAAAIHLVETSQRLRKVQRDALAHRDIGWRDVSWHNGFGEIPDGPCLIVANEFLDALPAHQFERTPRGWRERLVGLSEDGGLLQLALAPGPTPALSLSPTGAPAGLGDADIGAVAEIQPTAIALTRAIAERIRQAGGAALIIDYGYDGGVSDTLQAVRKHAFHDVLQTPGEADLTVHVDFAALRHAIGSAVRGFGPVGQGEFLSELGIAVRAQMLMKSATPAQAKDIATAHHRLIDADEMGTLFKVFGVAPNGAASLPGFD